MPSNADNVILTFPPRPVSRWDRATLAEWFAAVQRDSCGVANAYVCERRGEDPMLAGRILVFEQPGQEPSYVVYSPAESTFWVVASSPALGHLRRFGTLRGALNAIRPVLEEPDQAEDLADSLAR
jgi:hypothetical protein